MVISKQIRCISHQAVFEERLKLGHANAEQSRCHVLQQEWMTGITRGNHPEMETNYPVEILIRFKLA
jgi:hypothetical protein